VRILRIIACLGLAGVVAQSLMLWNATGRRTFTFLPDPGLNDLAASEGTLTGLFDDATPTSAPPIRTTFSLGILPSGLGPGMVSVAGVSLLCAPALVILARPSRRPKI